jgi:hypothetical protein
MYPIYDYIQLLEKETEEFGRLKIQEFRRHVANHNAESLYKMLLWCQDYGCRWKLLRKFRPSMVEEALARMKPHLVSEMLVMMKEKKRRKVVSCMSLEQEELTLKYLDLWQELESYHWNQRVLPALVMTEDGRLPDYYPSSMDRCSACKRTYTQWDTVSAANCNIHSTCEFCILPESVCPKC